MLKRTFDPRIPHPYVTYLRMSTDQQNPRSPKQQRDTIEMVRTRLGLPWVLVDDYTDAGISGRLIGKRPGFQRMLRDIRTRVIKIDLILVDSFERFGRANEMDSIRRELYNRHGILVLTADNNFADPTTIQGKALAAFESLRATEENRIKAHQVLRGKRDAARLCHWPGGSPPFGYRLKSLMTEKNGRQVVDYCVLVPDPETAWIIQLLFTVAAEKGLGCYRLARMLNDNPDIPDRHKPFYDQTINYWLSQSIYYGELRWEVHATDVIDDRRVIEANPLEEILRVPDFCEPLVSRVLWDRVQEVRRARAERGRLARQAQKDDGGKQIAAVAPGIALKYLLSGLVQCAHCNRSMRASSSPVYTTKSGEEKRYVTYACPGFAAGVCHNGTRVPEAWLRQEVLALVRRRLFPDPE
jgi:site-specific DNA recombinase